MPPETSHTLRVATWNIRGGLGMDDRRDLRRICTEMRGFEADVIALQEVHQWLIWSELKDQPAIFARALGYHRVFLSSVRFGPGHYGTMLLSRFPLVEARRALLPSVGEQRAATFARLEWPGPPLVLANTHLGLVGGERAAQAEAILDASSEDDTTLLTGDFNEEPDGPAVQTLLAGGFRLLGPEDPTYPSDQPGSRIDLVLARGPLTSHSVSVRPSIASDHRPVLIDLSLP